MMKSKNIKKILIIKNDKIGDMVLSSGIFRELRKNFPESEITVIASFANKSLIEKNKNIDKIIVMDYPSKIGRKFWKLIREYFRMSKQIKKEKFDLGIDLRGSIFNSFILLSLGRVKYKTGFYNRFISKFFLDYPYKKDRIGKHVTFQRIDLINRALGIKSKNFWPEIATDKFDEHEARRIIKKNNLKKFISIIPFASFEKKQWDLNKFNEVIKYLHDKYLKYKILLIAGLDDLAKIKKITEKNPFCIPVTHENLRVIYLLLKRSRLVIAPDGGPMHLAWASKTKTLSIIPGYLHVNYIKPLGNNSRMLVSGKNSINSISTEEVKKEIDFLLKKND